MGTLLVLKEVERDDLVEFNFEKNPSQHPAVILDFNQKYQKKLENLEVSQWAHDGLSVLKVIALDYERLMRVLAEQITAEQLALVTPLSADEQIKEDIRRIHDLIAALEVQVSLKAGRSLQEAYEDLKKDQSELGVVASYLEKNDYTLFKVMVKVIGWASVSVREVDESELALTMDGLIEMGACDTANALVFLQSRSLQ